MQVQRANPRESTDWLRQQINTVRERTGKPFGVGFISSAPHLDELFQVTIEERVPAISHSFADPTPYVSTAHDAGVKVLAQIQTVAQAKRASQAGVDIIAAQGNSAGGHTGYSATVSLVPSVIDVVEDIPVVASGGLADGRGLAAMLMLGAEGVWLGTRFVLSHESIIPDWKKKSMLQAGTDDTSFTRTQDLINDAPFPAYIGNRVLKNNLTAQWHGKDEKIVAHRKELMEQLELANQNEDPSVATIHAGNAVGLLSSLEPAASIVHSIMEEAELILRNRPQGVLVD